MKSVWVFGFLDKRSDLKTSLWDLRDWDEHFSEQFGILYTKHFIVKINSTFFDNENTLLVAALTHW